MTLSEDAINYLEEHIPELAKATFTQAYWAALASGSSVIPRRMNRRRGDKKACSPPWQLLHQRDCSS